MKLFLIQALICLPCRFSLATMHLYDADVGPGSLQLSTPYCCYICLLHIWI